MPLQEKEFDHKFLPVLLHNPGGDQFALLFLCFTNYVIKKAMLKNLTLAELPIEELRLRGKQESEELRKANEHFRAEKELLADGIKEFVRRAKQAKQQMQAEKDELSRLDAQLVEQYGWCDQRKLEQSVGENLKQIQALAQPLQPLAAGLDALLRHEFDNEKLIVDASKLTTDRQPLDLLEKYGSIQHRLDAFKGILQKGRQRAQCITNACQ